MKGITKLLEYVCDLCEKTETTLEELGVPVILVGRSHPIRKDTLSLEELVDTGEVAVICPECEEKLLAPLAILKGKKDKSGTKLGNPPRVKEKRNAPLFPGYISPPPLEPLQPYPGTPSPWSLPGPTVTPTAPWTTWKLTTRTETLPAEDGWDDQEAQNA